MIKKRINNLDLYFFENLSKYPEVLHFVTTKPLNISFSAGGDNHQQIEVNRRLMAKALKTSLDNFIFMGQIHGNNSQVVTEKDRGRGVKNSGDEIKAIDAMMTKSSNIMICVKTADCVPILMFDPFKKVIAAVHAGRKGTELKITEKVIEEMKKKFRVEPENFIVGLGPSIGPCHYEVDLWSENKKQLINSGVLEKNIEVSKICTFCHKDEFFSARGDGASTGRFATGVMLKNL